MRVFVLFYCICGNECVGAWGVGGGLDSIKSLLTRIIITQTVARAGLPAQDWVPVDESRQQLLPELVREFDLDLIWGRPMDGWIARRSITLLLGLRPPRANHSVLQILVNLPDVRDRLVEFAGAHQVCMCACISLSRSTLCIG